VGQRRQISPQATHDLRNAHETQLANPHIWDGSPSQHGLFTRLTHDHGPHDDGSVLVFQLGQPVLAASVSHAACRPIRAVRSTASPRSARQRVAKARVGSLVADHRSARRARERVGEGLR
jgi:hypothetical protein